MASTNQRQAPRTPVTLKIKFKSETLDQFIERYSVDVSQGGIFIRTKEPLPVGTTLRFEFQLKDASPLIRGEGTVVWTRDRESSTPGVAPGMGVRFESLPGQSQEVLERILAQKAPKPTSAAESAPGAAKGEFSETPTRVAPASEFGETPTRVAPDNLVQGLRSEPGADEGSTSPPRQSRGDLPLRASGAKTSARKPTEDRTPLPDPMPFHPDADDFGDEAFQEATKVANYGNIGLGELRTESSAASEDAEKEGHDAPSDFDDQPTGQRRSDEIEASLGQAPADGSESTSAFGSEASDIGQGDDADASGGEAAGGSESPFEQSLDASAGEDPLGDALVDNASEAPLGDVLTGDSASESPFADALGDEAESEAGDDAESEGAKSDLLAVDDAVETGPFEKAPAGDADAEASRDGETREGDRDSDRAAREARSDEDERGASAQPAPGEHEESASGEGEEIEPSWASANGESSQDDAIREVRDELAMRRARSSADAEDEAQEGSEAPRAQTETPPAVGSDEAMERARALAMRDAPRLKGKKRLAIGALLVVAAAGGGGYYMFEERGASQPAVAAIDAAVEEEDDAQEAAEAPSEPDETPASSTARALSVETDPPGATVELVEEGRRASAPARFEDLDPDREYALRVSHPSYRARDIRARPGDDARVELEPLPRVLAIKSQPPGASITINGERQGQTPAEIPLEGELEDAERYRIALRRRGFHRSTETLESEIDFEREGETLVREVRVRLSRREQEEPSGDSQGDDESAGETPGESDEATAGEESDSSESGGSEGEDGEEEQESSGAGQVEDLTRGRAEDESGDESGDESEE